MSQAENTPPADKLDELLQIKQELANQEVENIAESVRQQAKLKGAVVDIRPLADTDWIEFVHENGTPTLVERRAVFERVVAVLDGLLAETASADPAQMDKDLWLCEKAFKAALASGRARGKSYNSSNIKRFEAMLSKACKSWRNKHDNYSKRYNKRNDRAPNIQEGW